MFLVQFKRLRRGVPEVIRTLHFPAVDAAARGRTAFTAATSSLWDSRSRTRRMVGPTSGKADTRSSGSITRSSNRDM